MKLQSGMEHGALFIRPLTARTACGNQWDYRQVRPLIHPWIVFPNWIRQSMGGSTPKYGGGDCPGFLGPLPRLNPRGGSAAPRSLNMPKARILCLHAYAQNGDFFRSRTGALRKALKAVADFHFIDAPHPATAEFLGDVPEERGSALGWFNVGETAPGSRPAISAHYVGMDAALSRVRLAVECDGPFDAILGFSQGATMAAFCCLHPEAWWHGAGAHPFRFAILFSAFSPRDPAWSLAGSPAPPTLPSFHCFGLNDASVPADSSRRVASHFVAPREHEHEGGHGVPSDAQLRTALKDFISMCAAGSGGGSGSGGSGMGGSIESIVLGGGGKGGDRAGWNSQTMGAHDGPVATSPPSVSPGAMNMKWATEEAARFSRTYGFWRELGGP